MHIPSVTGAFGRRLPRLVPGGWGDRRGCSSILLIPGGEPLVSAPGSVPCSPLVSESADSAAPLRRCRPWGKLRLSVPGRGAPSLFLVLWGARRPFGSQPFLGCSSRRSSRSALSAPLPAAPPAAGGDPTALAGWEGSPTGLWKYSPMYRGTWRL